VLCGVGVQLLLRPAFSCHYTLKRIVLQIEGVGEFESRVYFVVLEGVKVEDDSLQIHNQHIGRLCDELSLLNINLLLAVFTLEVINDRTLNHLLKTGLKTLAILDLNA
jgi:hypothetical protein